AVDLALADRLQPVDDPVDAGLDVLALDRALLQRHQDAVTQLRLVERLAPVVALGHVGHDQLGGLERREALAAFDAGAAPSNLPALAGEARVDDLRVLEIAERAVHGPLPAVTGSPDRPDAGRKGPAPRGGCGRSRLPMPA